MLIATLIIVSYLYITQILDIFVEGKSELAAATALAALLWWNVSLAVAIIVICVGVLAWVISVAKK